MEPVPAVLSNIIQDNDAVLFMNVVESSQTMKAILLDDVQLLYCNLSDDGKAQAAVSIYEALATAPLLDDAEALHNLNVATLQEKGWTYADRFNEAHQQSPFLMDFDDLPQSLVVFLEFQKLAIDGLFHSLVPPVLEIGDELA